jgi:hypothetical protein
VVGVQNTDVRPAGQVPLYTTTVAKAADENEERVMVCWVLSAVKVYHTSGSTLVLLHIDCVDVVAFMVVPAVCVQIPLVLTGNVIAPAHSSLAGAGGGGVVMQKLKVAPGGLVNILA